MSHMQSVQLRLALRNTQKDRHAVNAEASMSEESVESYAKTLATAGDTEGVKGDDEVRLRIALKADGEHSEY
jgi:hypothetical protein